MVFAFFSLCLDQSVRAEPRRQADGAGAPSADHCLILATIHVLVGPASAASKRTGLEALIKMLQPGTPPHGSQSGLSAEIDQTTSASATLRIPAAGPVARALALSALRLSAPPPM
jgi:hypothetical protein